MGKYFGTDGFRGEANVNLTADHAYKVGRFLGWYYGELKRRRQLRPTLVSLSPNAITERYMRLADRLNVPRRFHNLRHYHASVMLREGVPEKYITADMGHASFDMVKRVYGHVMEEKKRTIHTAMDAHADTILTMRHKNCHAVAES